MNNLSIYDELDQAIDQMLRPSAPKPGAPGTPSQAAANVETTDVRELVELASDLRDLPRANFKSRLQLELEWEAAGRAVTADADQQRQPGRRANTEVLPSLFGKSWSGYPVRRSNFALSAALHALMMLAVGAGFVMVKNMPRQADLHVNISSRIEPYIPPVGMRESGGGGSGGAADRLPASKGMAPRPAREQLAQPIPLENNFAPKLPVAQTIVAPPDLNSAKMRQIGDPLSLLAKPSNGPGVGGGMGVNSGDGIGTGKGPGRGR